MMHMKSCAGSTAALPVSSISILTLPRFPRQPQVLPPKMMNRNLVLLHPTLRDLQVQLRGPGRSDTIPLRRGPLANQILILTGCNPSPIKSNTYKTEASRACETRDAFYLYV